MKTQKFRKCKFKASGNVQQKVNGSLQYSSKYRNYLCIVSLNWLLKSCYSFK